MASKKVLFVAEKPSVANEIAKLLSGGASRTISPPNHNGRNALWELSAEVGGYGRCTVHVASVRGHLMEMDFEPPYE
jgi:DNA topoisomerase-3